MKAGDFVQIEYTGRVRETGDIFDTTDEALAKKNGIFNRGARYGAVTIILGAGYVLPGLDKKILSSEPNISAKFEISPDDAFGKRDPKLIQLASGEQFKKQRIVPVAGQYITLGNNISGKILSVSSGRVKIDFNHPLAGKNLEYDVKIHSLVEDAKKKVEAVVDFYLGALSTAVSVSVTDAGAEISAQKEIMKIIPSGMKEKISDDIKKYAAGVPEVLFSEKKEETKKENVIGKA